jgi:hypothetical protein
MGKRMWYEQMAERCLGKKHKNWEHQGLAKEPFCRWSETRRHSRPVINPERRRKVAVYIQEEGAVVSHP